MTDVGRMNPDAKNIQGNVPKGGRSSERGKQTPPGAARPGYYRSARELFPSRGRPHAHVVFSQRNACLAQRIESTRTIEPGGRDEAIDLLADYVFDQIAPGLQAIRCLFAGKAKKLALASSHETRAKPIARTRMSAVITVVETVQKHLNPVRSPIAKAACERRPWDDRRIPPMIGHDEHGHSRADMNLKAINKPIHFSFEAR